MMLVVPGNLLSLLYSKNILTEVSDSTRLIQKTPANRTVVQFVQLYPCPVFLITESQPQNCGAY